MIGRKISAAVGVFWCVMLALFIALPIISSFIFSLGQDRFPTLPPSDFSSHWYAAALHDPKDLAALWRTLLVGFSVAATAVVIGFGAAYADWRYQFSGKNIFLGMVLLPPTVPLVIFGLAMLAYLSRVGLSGRVLSIWICHVVVCIPFAMAIIRLRLHQMDKNLEAAAWNLGASEWQALRFVIIPFVAPAIVAAALISLAVSFDEYTVAWFVSGINETLPVRVLNFLQGQVSPRINVIGSLTFLVTITLVTSAQLLIFRRKQ